MKTKKPTPEEREILKQHRQILKEQNKRIRYDRVNMKRAEERADKKAIEYVNILKETTEKANNNNEVIDKELNFSKVKPAYTKIYIKAVVNRIIRAFSGKNQLYLSEDKGKGKNYALNTHNLKLINAYLNGEPLKERYGKESDDEVEAITEDAIKQNKPLSIIIKPFIHTYEKKRGAFFPYYNNTDLDLTEYQIVTKNNKSGEPDILKDNCLIYALAKLGLSTNKQAQIKKYTIGREVILSDIAEIAKETNISINLYYKYRDRNQTRTNKYGDNTEEIYNIALHSGHYFIYNNTDYTTYFINNYDELRDITNANHIYKKRDNSYRRDAKRTINSLDLIDELVKNRETLLTEITNQNINNDERPFVKTSLTDKYTDLTYKFTDGLIKKYKPTVVIDENIRNDEPDDDEPDENPPDYEPDEPDDDEIEKRKKRRNYNNIVYADFETIEETDGEHRADMLIGRLYDKRNNLIKSVCKSRLDGEDFVRQFLKEIITDYTIIYFHNAKYDINFLARELRGTGECLNGGAFIYHKGRFSKYSVIIKDSYKIISEPLANFPNIYKSIEGCKEYINHQFYKYNDVYTKPLYSKDEFLEQFNPKSTEYIQVKNYKPDTAEIVLNNCERLGFINEAGLIDAYRYRKYYCEQDVRILSEGMLNIRRDFLGHFSLDVYNYLTIPSLAIKILKDRGALDDCYYLSGHIRQFIEEAIVGGRTMTANNTKQYQTGQIVDFDAVSLYPSAMTRIEGFLKGAPKVLQPNQLNYKFLSECDGYYIQIKIVSLINKRAFPLQSIKNKEGTRIFTNNLIGETIIIDKTALEDLIRFQGVSFEIIQGYYFNNGFNSKITDIIKFLFNKRLELKAVKSPAEKIYKLILNSAYGKLIEKEHTEGLKIITGKHNIETFVSRNYNEIKTYTYYDTRDGKEKARVSVVAGRKLHFNMPHLGVQVLSMSKRIMNEVMTTAEDAKINLYYQDTDSIFLDKSNLSKLTDEFQVKYNRDLVGEDLGQFKGDLKIDRENIVLPKDVEINEATIYASPFIALGKKSYIGELYGIDTKTNIKYFVGNHARMKGVSIEAMNHAVANNDDMEILTDLYSSLYNQKVIECDLTAGGEIARFNINSKSNRVSTKSSFLRNISFPEKPITYIIKSKD